MKDSEIIDKSNLILKSTGKQVNKRSDLLAIDYFITLINVLANKDYQIPSNEKLNDFFYNICKELSLPKFVKGDDFGTTDPEVGQVILYLIQEVFKQYSDEISDLKKDQKEKKVVKKDKNSEDDDIEEEDDDDHEDYDNDLSSNNAADDGLIFDHDKLFTMIEYFFTKEGDDVYKLFKLDFNKSFLQSFFADVVSFPRYACLLAHTSRIPKVNMHPLTKKRKIKNVDIALQFLSYEVEDLSGMYTAKYVPRSEPYIISYILNHHYYTMHDSEIIEKANLILKPTKKKIRSKSDLLSMDFFISLINVLADKNYSIPSKENLDDEYQKICSELKIPSFLDADEFGSKNHETALVNIYLIQELFSIYSEKITKLIENQQGENNNFDDDDENNSDCFQRDTRENKIIDVTIEERENIVLLKLINHFASKMKLSFHDITQAFEEGYIPKFVMKFMKLKSIENVNISENNTIDENIINVEAVIEYLKQKNDVFKTTLFDFKSPMMREFSCKLFFRNFFNSFFIKSTRDEMINRYNILAEDNVTTENTELLYHPFIFTNLLTFLSDGIVDKKANVDETSSNEEFKYYFKEAHVPMILTIRALECALDYPDLEESFYFQLQLVFNAIDSANPSRHLIEKFKIAKNKIKHVAVPKISTLVIAMKAKVLNKKDNKEKNSQNETEIKNKSNSEIKKPRTFEERNTSEIKKRSLEMLKSEFSRSSSEKLEYLDFQIHKKLYWSNEHISLIINTHMNFLDEEFLSILKAIFDDEEYYLLFEQNIDILEDQKLKDRKKIEILFESYMQDIKTKETPVKLDMKETKEKGTSYIMKETQKVTEIKVTVQMDQDLKSIIEQDF